LTRAYYRFNLAEKRVMETLISKVNPRISRESISKVEVTAIDFAKCYGIPPTLAYRQLSAASDKLLTKFITIPISENKKMKINLTSSALYEKDSGKITITLNEMAKPHLLNLSKQFTKYPVKSVVNFKSSYTWRLYEIIISWAKDPKKASGKIEGWFKVGVEEIRDMLGAPKSYRWSNLKRKALNVAIDEIKTKAGIVIELEEEKSGKSVASVKFTFFQI